MPAKWLNDLVSLSILRVIQVTEFTVERICFGAACVGFVGVRDSLQPLVEP